MLDLEIKGTLYAKGDEVQRTETFKVREFVVEVVGERFTDYVKMQLANDKCALIDRANIGDIILVKANLGGRKSLKDGKESFFNSVNAWYIKVENEAVQPGVSTQQQTQPEPQKGDGDLPF